MGDGWWEWSIRRTHKVIVIGGGVGGGGTGPPMTELGAPCTLPPPKLWHQWTVTKHTVFGKIPVSSATAERSFSAMRRLKTYLRSTCMSTERLNSVVTLHVHKDLLDCIDDSAVVKDFVACCNEVRKDIFGKGLNLPAPLDIQWPNAFSFRGASPPWPLTRGSAPGPRWGLCQTPVIGSCSALAMLSPPQPLTPSAAYALNPLKCASLHRLQAAIMLIKGLLSKYAKLTILKYLALRKERVVPICLNTV